MAQINTTADEKAGYRALRAAMAVLPTNHPAAARAGDGIAHAQFTDYAIPAPSLYTLLITNATGAAAITGYANLAALKAAVAAM
jgi:hypothetical protein